MKRNNRFSKLVRKLNSSRGFSLSEVLICTLIMLFAGSILTTTITLAARNYDKQVLISKSDVLCETLSYSLRDKLGGVVKRKVTTGSSGSTVQYYSTSSGLEYYPFSIVEDEGKINLKYDFSSYTDSSVGDGTYHLVNDAAYYDGALFAKVNINEKKFEGSENVEFFIVQLGVFDKEHSSGELQKNDPNALSYVEFMVYPLTDTITNMK